MAMVILLALYILVCGGSQLLAYWHLHALFDLGRPGSVRLAVWLGAMTAAPLLGAVMNRLQLHLLARALAFVGYAWMGFLFLFFTIYLALLGADALLSALRLPAQVSLPPAWFAARSLLLVSLGLAIVVSVYGYVEGQMIRIERIVIPTPKLPPDVRRLRIAQISDVHLGLIIHQRRLNRIIAKLEIIHPDLLVSTGDLLDAQVDGCEDFAQRLSQLQPRLGKYAVLGNHEFYSGLGHALDFTRRAGFQVLRGEALTVGDLLNIAGVDDPAGVYFKVYRDVSEKDLLAGLPRDKFTLLLKHRPVPEAEALGWFDLQLSGHAHRGQIFPFHFLTRLSFPFHSGYFELPERSRLYVSRGTGLWGPPMRLLAAPEITLIELIPSGESSQPQLSERRREKARRVIQRRRKRPKL